MKIAALIPTRGKERADFVSFAARQMKLQTHQPNKILFVDYEPESHLPDITGRYKQGYEQLKSEGFDLCFFIEDDDYYSPKYIEFMLEKWTYMKQPDLFGSHITTYYHLINQSITRIEHRGRASMFSTLIKLNIEKPIAWGLSSYKFTDIVLWSQLNGKTFENSKHTLGIKHGMGLCGGSGHKIGFKNSHTYHDKNHEFLKKFVHPEAFDFYMEMKNKITSK